MKIKLLFIALFLTSCFDNYEKKKQSYLQKKFPDHTVKPTEGILRKAGYDFILIDPRGKVYATDMLSEPMKIKIDHVGNDSMITIIP